MAIILAKNGMEILVDNDKYEELSKYKWNINNKDYAEARINGKPVSMHRYLTDCPKGMVVDHINLRKLDNRMENLEIVTAQENSRRYNEFYRNRKRDELGYLVPYNKSVQK